jgi:starch synthase
MDPLIKVFFLAAEADPFVKVGGLGDVAGSLPQALHASGCVDIRLAIPYYGAIQRRSYPMQTIAIFNIDHDNGPIRAKVSVTKLNGLTVYFVSGDPIPPNAPVYSTSMRADGHKFTFFSLACLELARVLEWAPDVIHANDWHTAPALYDLMVHPDQFFMNTAKLLGLHNLPFMGDGAGPAMQAFGLPAASGSRLPWWARDMPLPLGLLAADHIIAASPTYAREILTPEFGSGLEEFLITRADQISGILNGIDTKKWDPATDKFISKNFSVDRLEDKAVNRAALIGEFDLNPDPGIPLLAMVTRIDKQKGVDLVPDALRASTHLPWQMIFLGTGDPSLETSIRELEAELPNRVRAVIRFDAELSHRIYAGADALLIPSRYEPCGLTQMLAMRYGGIPVARATGGLLDTILDVDLSNKGTGFLFTKPDSTDLARCIQRMVYKYQDRDAWQLIQTCAMGQDFAWENSARQYIDKYRALLLDQSGKKEGRETGALPVEER